MTEMNAMPTEPSHENSEDERVQHARIAEEVRHHIDVLTRHVFNDPTDFISTRSGPIGPDHESTDEENEIVWGLEADQEFFLLRLNIQSTETGMPEQDLDDLFQDPPDVPSGEVHTARSRKPAYDVIETLIREAQDFLTTRPEMEWADNHRANNEDVGDDEPDYDYEDKLHYWDGLFA